MELMQCCGCRKISKKWLAESFSCWFCGGHDGDILNDRQAALEAWTTIYVAAVNFQEDIPYTVASAVLSDGTRVVGRLTASEHDVVTGMLALVGVDERWGIILNPLSLET